jgi:hypothetical protein
MDVVESYSPERWLDDFRKLPDYALYLKNKKTSSQLLAASSAVIKMMNDDLLLKIRDKPIVTPQKRVSDVSWDLRLHYSSGDLADEMEKENYFLHRAMESSITTAKNHGQEWHVWISTIIGTTKVASRDRYCEVYKGCFLYPQEKSKILKKLSEIKLTTIEDWTEASLSTIVNIVQKQPTHFSIRIPKTRQSFFNVAHGCAVLKELNEVTEASSLIPYSYGMYECSGVIAEKEDTIVSTCVPINAFETSGYAIEETLPGETLGKALLRMTQDELDKTLAVIAHTLDYLYEVHGFVHCNLTTQTIIINRDKKTHNIVYLVRGETVWEAYTIRLPFSIKMTNFEDSITNANPWISDKGVPGQSPVIDVLRLYTDIKDVLKASKSKLDTSTIDKHLNLLSNKGIKSDALVMPSSVMSLIDIHEYIIQSYDMESRVWKGSAVPNLPQIEGQFRHNYEHDTELLYNMHEFMRTVKAYTTKPLEYNILRDWVNLNYTEGLERLGEGEISVNPLPIYYTPDGVPLVYSSDGTLILKDDDGKYLVPLTVDGFPQVYDSRGSSVIYDAGFAEGQDEENNKEIITKTSPNTNGSDEEEKEEEEEEEGEEYDEEE